MSIFKVWITSNAETIDDAETISWPWSEPEECLERYVRERYTDLGSPSNLNIALLEIDSFGRPCNETQIYNIVRRNEPTFVASKIK